MELLLPSFNHLLAARSALIMLPLSVVVVVVIAVGLLAGLTLRSLSHLSARVLSGDLQRGNTAILVRKSLPTLQAGLAIGLIIASVTLQSQLAHLQNLPLGYETDQRLWFQKCR